MGRVRGSARRAVAMGLLAWTLAAAPQLARAQDTVAFTLTDPRIIESGGLAADPRINGYWTANDSGDSGRVFAIDPTGKTLGVVTYRATPVDVEALAVRGPRLYVADIGDNFRRRSRITIYFFDNLSPRAGTATYGAYDFAYPDGPHDAETLLIDPAGRLLVVTKEAHGSIYLAPAQLSRTGTNVLRRVGRAPSEITDGVYLPDGRIALRTYVSVQVVDPAASYAVVAQAPVPLQPEGETVGLNLAGNGLLIGSEGRRSSVYAAPIPDSLASVASAGPTPPAVPSSARPSSQSSDTGNGAGDSGDTSARTPSGTLQAVGLAALVALVAGGVVVLAWGRR